MNPAKRSRNPHLQIECDAWNRAWPVGTRVVYHSVIGEAKGIHTRTRSQAYVLSGHTAVVFVEGVAGCVALDAVDPAPEGNSDVA